MLFADAFVADAFARGCFRQQSLTSGSQGGRDIKPRKLICFNPATLRVLSRMLGMAQEGDSESSPQNQLAAAWNYLQNQASRMDYPEFRKQGLPITSAHIESTIKQLNQRVKGTEKFWSINADPILQLRADYLSETEPLKTFWENRARNLSPATQYKMVT